MNIVFIDNVLRLGDEKYCIKFDNNIRYRNCNKTH